MTTTKTTTRKCANELETRTPQVGMMTMVEVLICDQTPGHDGNHKGIRPDGIRIAWRNHDSQWLR